MKPFEPEIGIYYLFAKEHREQRSEVVYVRDSEEIGRIAHLDMLDGPTNWRNIFNNIIGQGYTFERVVDKHYIPAVQETDSINPYLDPDSPESKRAKRVLDEIFGKVKPKDPQYWVEKHRRRQKKKGRKRRQEPLPVWRSVLACVIGAIGRFVGR